MPAKTPKKIKYVDLNIPNLEAKLGEAVCARYGISEHEAVRQFVLFGMFLLKQGTPAKCGNLAEEMMLSLAEVQAVSARCHALCEEMEQVYLMIAAQEQSGRAILNNLGVAVDSTAQANDGA